MNKKTALLNTYFFLIFFSCGITLTSHGAEYVNSYSLNNDNILCHNFELIGIQGASNDNCFKACVRENIKLNNQEYDAFIKNGLDLFEIRKRINYLLCNAGLLKVMDIDRSICIVNNTNNTKKQYYIPLACDTEIITHHHNIKFSPRASYLSVPSDHWCNIVANQDVTGYHCARIIPYIQILGDDIDHLEVRCDHYWHDDANLFLMVYTKYILGVVRYQLQNLNDQFNMQQYQILRFSLDSTRVEQKDVKIVTGIKDFDRIIMQHAQAIIIFDSCNDMIRCELK